MIEQDRLGTIARKFSQSGVSNSVTDAPRFKYRGFFADGARHFLSLPILRRVVEGLSAAKLNKLHWHLADDQSFPLGACETTALFLKKVNMQHDHLPIQARNKQIREIECKGLVAQTCPRGRCSRAQGRTQMRSAIHRGRSPGQ